ncbi:hypothetical protein PAPYR_11390 [Paratrimastix pyriformis]|uniref:Uncharacterized protein n=1 Tax=Paratrimastix pyriformis TaxID=342808 RepID=A0ABQ8U9K8_9EUKA|nr:hypothetical protein PAPYR_11390 [Paratrimastix pyriformis]
MSISSLPVRSIIPTVSQFPLSRFSESEKGDVVIPIAFMFVDPEPFSFRWRAQRGFTNAGCLGQGQVSAAAELESRQFSPPTTLTKPGGRIRSERRSKSLRA